MIKIYTGWMLQKFCVLNNENETLNINWTENEQNVLVAKIIFNLSKNFIWCQMWVVRGLISFRVSSEKQCDDFKLILPI